MLASWVKDFHGREHYDYQKLISHAIIEAVVASNIENKTFEAAFEFPRQCGKTTGVVDAVEFILGSFYMIFGRPISVGIFAPQVEQATTDFERLKNQFTDLDVLNFRTTVKRGKEEAKIPERWNSKTIRIYNQSGQYIGEVYIFPISKTSKPESKTFDLIIVEEAQDVDDDRMKNAVFPMGASTNAPRIYIGTAGTKLCYFKEQGDNNPRSKRISIEKVYEDRRAMYEQTKDSYHLKYKIFVDSEIRENGLDSDYVQRQYLGKWILGIGQFTTIEKIDALIGEHGIISENKNGDWPCYAGIDTAKFPDKTVVTLLRDNKKTSRTELCNWLVLQGENYENQFYIIKDWLSQYQNIRMVAIDSTGQGDFMPDMFENHASYNVERVKFSPQEKDVLYKGLLQVIENKLTLLPNVAMDSKFREFRQEMINLQKEYKGRFLSVHHPDDPKAHDDYADSWALAEYAKTKAQEREPRITFI